MAQIATSLKLPGYLKERPTAKSHTTRVTFLVAALALMPLVAALALMPR